MTPAILAACRAGVAHRVLETIHVSAGRRGLEIALAPDQLVRLTGALVAPIARPDPH